MKRTSLRPGGAVTCLSTVTPSNATSWTAPQTFQAGILSGTVTLSEGHLVSKQLASPTWVVSNSANVSASLMSATDVAGKLLVTLSAGASSSDYVQVNFNRPYAAPPIIVITADTALDLRERCLAAGANEVLFKPVAMDALFEAMGRILAQDPGGATIG